MDKAALVQYRERWRLVNQVQIEERRTRTVAERLQQLRAFQKMRERYNMRPFPPNVEEVRQRWIQLKADKKQTSVIIAEIAPMILPIHLLPQIFGLRWGMTPDECRVAIQHPPIQEHPDKMPFLRWQVYRLSVQEDIVNTALQFDEQGLGCIYTVTQVSQDFWEYVEDDVREAIEAEFIGYYRNAVEMTAAAIGLPDYQYVFAEHVYDDETDESRETESKEEWTEWWKFWQYCMFTYWDRETNRLQIELDQQDRELPFTVTVRVMRR